MKVLFLSDNKISDDLICWLKNASEEDVITYDKPVSTEFLKKINPDFLISYNYKYIVKKEVIDYMKNFVINLHISLLPWNKGAHPNVWSSLENTPRGVTIHIIDKRADERQLYPLLKINEVGMQNKLSHLLKILQLHNIDEFWNKVLISVKDKIPFTLHEYGIKKTDIN